MLGAPFGGLHGFRELCGVGVEIGAADLAGEMKVGPREDVGCASSGGVRSYGRCTFDFGIRFPHVSELWFHPLTFLLECSIFFGVVVIPSIVRFVADNPELSSPEEPSGSVLRLESALLRIGATSLL